MNNELTAEEIRNIVELTKRVAEDKNRQATNIAALEKAREQIKECGQFLPKEIKSEMPVIVF